MGDREETGAVPVLPGVPPDTPVASPEAKSFVEMNMKDLFLRGKYKEIEEVGRLVFQNISIEYANLQISDIVRAGRPFSFPYGENGTKFDLFELFAGTEGYGFRRLFYDSFQLKDAISVGNVDVLDSIDEDSPLARSKPKMPGKGEEVRDRQDRWPDVAMDAVQERERERNEEAKLRGVQQKKHFVRTEDTRTPRPGSTPEEPKLGFGG